MALEIKNALLEGLNIGLVSDAGTPLISDPGYKVVDLIKDEYEIISIPDKRNFNSSYGKCTTTTTSYIYWLFRHKKNKERY